MGDAGPAASSGGHATVSHTPGTARGRKRHATVSHTPGTARGRKRLLDAVIASDSDDETFSGFSASSDSDDTELSEGLSTEDNEVELTVAPKTNTKMEDDIYAHHKALLKRQRLQHSRNLGAEEKFDIVSVQLELRRNHFLAVKKSGGKKRNMNFTDETARLLNRSKKVVTASWKTFVAQEAMSATESDGPRGLKHHRIPITKKLRIEVRDWLHQRELNRGRTVAKDFMAWLVEKGYLESVPPSTKQYRHTLRTVQNFINRLHLRRGKRKGKIIYKERAENIRKRDRYIKKVLDLRDSRRFVFTDESFIHHHYRGNDDSIHDPEDDRPTPKAKHKGKRYCFIAAILSHDPTVPADDRTDADKAQLMKETIDIFTGGGKSSGKKKETKDYHGMFDSKYYLPWFDKLLNSLDERNIKNAVIVMDNAAYHKTLPDGTPRKSKCKKADMIEACCKFKIRHDASETCEVLWGKLSEYIKKNIRPEIVKEARDRGHELLYSAPHYSDLEPIETVWAIVKGRVGRQYNADTTFATVRERLEKAFDEVSSHEVGGCIKKAHKRLDELHKLVMKLDEHWDQDEMESDYPSDSASDDSFYSAEEGESDS